MIGLGFHCLRFARRFLGAGALLWAAAACGRSELFEERVAAGGRAAEASGGASARGGSSAFAGGGGSRGGIGASGGTTGGTDGTSKGGSGGTTGTAGSSAKAGAGGRAAGGTAGAGRSGMSGFAGSVLEAIPSVCPDTLGLEGLPGTVISHPLSMMVTGDFDGDGNLDVAALGADNVPGATTSLGVLLGDGHGSFRAELVLGTLTGFASLATGDFDGNGALDLVVTAPAGLTTFLGHGDGTFGSGVSTKLDANGTPPAVGDFDRDQRQDVAVTDGNGGVAVMLSNADGTFALAQRYMVMDASNVAAGDLNADGNIDLIVANGDAVVLLGVGGGNFQQTAEYTAPDGILAVTLADLNGDGRLDMAAAAECPPATTFGCTLLGNGDGTFQASIANKAWQLCGNTGVVADLDGDGVVDFVPSEVLLGNGDGTLRAGPAMPAMTNVIGDFTGDGKPDAVATALAPDRHGTLLYVLAGNGDGSFGAALQAPPGEQPLSIALADVNGDGKLDLLSARSSGPASDPGVFHVDIGNGDGTFTASNDYPTKFRPSGMAAGLLTLDRLPDVAIADGSAVEVFVNKGNGEFSSETSFEPNTQPNALTLADMNGNGYLDVVTASAQVQRVSVLLGNGVGSLGNERDYSLGDDYPSTVAVGDLDGDGWPDVAAAGLTSLDILFGRMDGSLSAPVSYRPSYEIDGLAIDDLDGDGNPDVIAAGGEGIDVLLGAGDGTFSERLTPVPIVSFSFALRDLDGDGHLDMLAPGALGVNVLWGKGDGTFRCATSYLPTSRLVAAGDVNDDGREDVVLVQTDGTVSVLLNRR